MSLFSSWASRLRPSKETAVESALKAISDAAQNTSRDASFIRKIRPLQQVADKPADSYAVPVNR